LQKYCINEAFCNNNFELFAGKDFKIAKKDKDNNGLKF